MNVTFTEAIESATIRTSSGKKHIPIYLPQAGQLPKKIGEWTGITSQETVGEGKFFEIDLDKLLFSKKNEPWAKIGEIWKRTETVGATFYIRKTTEGFFKDGNFYLTNNEENREALKDIKITETVEAERKWVVTTYPTYETTFDFPNTNVPSQTKYGSGITSRQGYYKRMYPDL